MPWHGTTLLVVAVRRGRAAGAPRTVAGGAGESIFQPRVRAGRRAARGRLGPHRLVEPVASATDRRARGLPARGRVRRRQWVLGMSSYDFRGGRDRVHASPRRPRQRLARLDVETARSTPFALPFDAFAGRPGRARGSARRSWRPATAPPTALCRSTSRAGAPRSSRAPSSEPLDPACLSRPEPVRFATAEGAHGARVPVPAGERHAARAGRRAAAARRDEPRRADGRRASRRCGSAHPVLDVARLRAARRQLRAAARATAARTGSGCAASWGVRRRRGLRRRGALRRGGGRADRARSSRRGGSAGGYTTLCSAHASATSSRPARATTASATSRRSRATRTSSSRATLDRLVGAVAGARRSLPRALARSHHADRLARPVIFFQGLEDRVVPPDADRGDGRGARARAASPHALVAFAGEGHGFRRAENMRRALEAELWFYGQVLGIPVDTAPEPVPVLR